MQREVEEFYNEGGNPNDSILPKSVEKRPIGCPKKFVATLHLKDKSRKSPTKRKV